MKGIVKSLNISKTKGIAKIPVKEAKFIQDFGIEGDAHAQPGIRQVSLLAFESISKQQGCPKVKNKGVNLSPGDFGENITTKGIDWIKVELGTKFSVGKEVILELSKIGKECHQYCSIYYKTGDCIMPREGVFARVVQAGIVYLGDKIQQI